MRFSAKTHIRIAIILTGLLIANPLLAQTSSSTSPDVDNGNGLTSAGMMTDSKNYDFHADLFTGRFMYGVPIAVAPGRHGVQPKITLDYNSSDGNGWCGVGWSLDVGYIQRDGRHGVPVKFSQTNALTQYDDSKGFIANFGGSVGQLVLVSATNVTPLVYRQKIDSSFSTFYFYQSNNYWQVVDKSGNSFYFGQGATNRMDNTKANWAAGAASSTFRWALDQSIDPNGNEVIYNYTNDSGTLYLQEISYNANTNSPGLPLNTIDFFLSDRPDTNFTFLSSYKVTTRKLLSEIQVKANGANVRRYVLGYTNSPYTPRSLLASVAEYGTNFTSHLPLMTFQYQVPIGAFTGTFWTNVTTQGKRTDGGRVRYDAIRAYDFIAGLDNGYVVDTIDIDGDGLPDRVMESVSSSKTNFVVQRNTGAGFAPETTWGPIGSASFSNDGWKCPLFLNSGSTLLELIDLNGDGYPDLTERQRNAPYDSFVVQLNSGLAGVNGFPTTNLWPVTNYDSAAAQWRTVKYNGAVDLFDMNGDGLPDRVSRSVNSPYNAFEVQINTGTNFLDPVDWAPLNSQGDTSEEWNHLYSSGTDSENPSHRFFKVTMADMNGDGLPDRVMRMINKPFTQFAVQFNNGAGFETNLEYWGPVETLGNTNDEPSGSPVSYVSVSGGGNGSTSAMAQLLDVNGDGLPDRLFNGICQLNTGTGFGQTNPPVAGGQYEYDGATLVEDFDINGDGLPDLVEPSSGIYGTNNPTSPMTWSVALVAGPYPDLLCGISNGLGGGIQISYAPSTRWNNRDRDWTNDPWAEGAKSLLSSVVQTVSQITTFDGMGTFSTNTYAYKGGYFNSQEREFRGFCEADVTDPLGTKTITHFHQSGGRDNSALGEYLDQGSEAKKGIPFRVDVIGSDGKTNSITLNKVEEVKLNTNGWYFPFVSQMIVMNYEGLSSYLATAKQMSYDTNTGNLIEEASLGDVANVDIATESCTNIGNDSIYAWTSYANLGNIMDRPSDVKVTSDSAGGNRLREVRMSYDSRGNATNTQAWLDTSGGFINIASASYDQYGNLTSKTDAAGITTSITYDATFEEFPIKRVAGTFTNLITYDPLSGQAITTTDAKGLVTSNSFDVFFRNVETYISTNSFGQPGNPSLWQTKTTYSLDGIVNGYSSNFVYEQVNDGVDTNSGYETYTYSDGIGRTIQTRSEAENGQFRVVNSYYDVRGSVYFQTLPRFESGTKFTLLSGTALGTLTEYDPIGRAFRSTPSESANLSGGTLSTSPTGGDTGSPVGPVSTAFVDGSNPWVVVRTNADGRASKSFSDAYGRVTNVTDVTASGTFHLSYGYDLVGDLTNVTDMVGNSNLYIFDSLGRKRQTIDPDAGIWTYSYDNAGRLTQQIDARTNKITFSYNDEIGRLTSKQLYNVSNALVSVVTYTYDASDDSNYKVGKGQLYKVTDRQGYSRTSYDIRGRPLKNGRYVAVNAMEYEIQAAYDDGDHLRQLTYPGNAAVVQYSYDTAGNVSKVESLSGTGTNQVFYTPQGFDELGRLTEWTDGAGSITTNVYFPNSKRLNRVQVLNGTNYLQDIAYTYDIADNLSAINDNVYSGVKSASLGNITYDGLYRVISLNSTARGLKNYAYDSIGNILTNSDFGSGLYQYGSKPHAVTSANGTNYQYDPCGNMVSRGSQILAYDEENQLVQVSSSTNSVMFGYDDSGERLWRVGTNGYTLWIGGIYEINNGKVLCHVLCNGKLLATFEPQCTAGLSAIPGSKKWYAITGGLEKVADWPLQNGRGSISLFCVSWMGIIVLCTAAGWGVRIKRREWLGMLRPRCVVRLAITLMTISVFINGEVVNADVPTYTPVFYFYHLDALGSSNILTDRAGNLVQQYEYTTFGQTGYADNTSAFPISNRYTGQISDDETGLYYYSARYYDPQLGRFIQPDSTIPDPSDQQSFNRYSYCRNNPLNATDPSGCTDMVSTYRQPIYIEDSGGNGPTTLHDDSGGGLSWVPGAVEEGAKWVSGEAKKFGAGVKDFFHDWHGKQPPADPSFSRQMRFEFAQMARTGQGIDLPAQLKIAYQNGGGGLGGIDNARWTVDPERQIFEAIWPHNSIRGPEFGQRLSGIDRTQRILNSVAIGAGGASGALSELSTAGSEIPTIGGRLPINSRYAGGMHPAGVEFTPEGFPDFSPHAVAKVELDGLTGNYAKDSAMANRSVGFNETPKGYVWHHVEDGRTMQLLPRDIHNAVRHTGGAAVIRNGGFDP